MKTETEVQNEILLRASQLGMRLFRNNVGVAYRDDGVPIRYGLANISKKMNQQLKSSDLIGITPTIITQDMIGSTVGIFTAIECKRENWKRGANKREEAQSNFIELIKSLGGRAQFCNNSEDIKS